MGGRRGRGDPGAGAPSRSVSTPGDRANADRAPVPLPSDVGEPASNPAPRKPGPARTGAPVLQRSGPLPVVLRTREFRWWATYAGRRHTDHAALGVFGRHQAERAAPCHLWLPPGRSGDLHHRGHAGQRASTHYEGRASSESARWTRSGWPPPCSTRTSPSAQPPPATRL